MLEEYEREKRKQMSSMRSMMDFAMGIIILSAGLFFFFRNRFRIEFNESFPPNDIDKIFGGICIVYGAWRIYRGFKKNYFK